MRKRLTTDEFIEKAKLIHANYKWNLVDYKNSRTPIKVICPIHGEFESIPANLLFGSGCRKCGFNLTSKALSSNTSIFLEKAKLIHPNYDWSLVSYKNNYTKIKIICPTHGIFESIPSGILQGQGCCKCGHTNTTKKITSNISEFLKKIKLINTKDNFDQFIYVNWHTKGKVVCPQHGLYEAIPNTLLNGCGCPKCGKTKKLNTVEFIEKAKVIHPQYNWDLVDYKLTKIKIKVICPIHGIFENTPNNILRGQGCSKCKESKGEKFVTNWLQQNGYISTPEKRFKTCKDKRELPFDFYINNTNILIEYDGEQHFIPKPFWGGEEALQNTIRRDNIKNEWAKNNGFIIIRLNYLMNDSDKINILTKMVEENLCVIK